MFISEEMQHKFSAAIWGKIPQSALNIYHQANARKGLNNPAPGGAEENFMSKLNAEQAVEASLQIGAANSEEISNLKESITNLEQAMAKSQTAGIAQGAADNARNGENYKAFMAFTRKGDVQAALSTGSDPDGGYAVPTVIDSQIETLLVNQSPMRTICNVVPITTPNYHKLVNLGGTASGWVGETDSRPETGTPSLAKLEPYMGEIYANPAATQQSLDDMGFDVESFLVDNIVEEFAVQEGTAFISGNGTKKPKGLLTYPTATTADASRAFGTLQYLISGDAAGFISATATASPADCLVNLIYSLKAGYRQGAVWLMNSNTLSVVSKFKDAVNGLPIWQRGLVEGQPSTLLGYSIVEDENMPDIGAGSLPIAFGNFKRGYTIVDRIGTKMLRDPYSNKPYVHFYTTKRIGGMLVNSQAIKLLKIAAS